MSDVLKHKLEQWLPEPPPTVWQGVEEQLAKDEYAPLGEKLAAFEVAPPQHVWQAIDQDLNHATPVIQLTHRRVWMRYAAGIAAALLIAYLTFRPSSDTSQPNVVRENAVLPTSPLPLKESAATKEAVVATSPKSKPSRATTRKVLSQVPDGALLTAQTAVEANIPLQEVVAVQTPSVNDQDLERYIVVETSSATVKLPKKVYNYFRCNDVPDKLACAFQLHQLRMKAASPSLLATSDFTGLLEMVQHVK